MTLRPALLPTERAYMTAVKGVDLNALGGYALKGRFVGLGQFNTGGCTQIGAVPQATPDLLVLVIERGADPKVNLGPTFRWSLVLRFDNSVTTQVVQHPVTQDLLTLEGAHCLAWFDGQGLDWLYLAPPAAWGTLGSPTPLGCYPWSEIWVLETGQHRFEKSNLANSNFRAAVFIALTQKVNVAQVSAAAKKQAVEAILKSHGIESKKPVSNEPTFPLTLQFRGEISHKKSKRIEAYSMNENGVPVFPPPGFVKTDTTNDSNEVRALVNRAGIDIPETPGIPTTWIDVGGILLTMKDKELTHLGSMLGQVGNFRGEEWAKILEGQAQKFSEISALLLVMAQTARMNLDAAPMPATSGGGKKKKK